MHLSLLRLNRGPAQDQDRFLRRFAEPGDYDQLLTTSTRVLRPDGTTLCVLLKNAISLQAGGAMYRAVRNKIDLTGNRATAAGTQAKKRIKSDGTVSKTMLVPQVQSSIMGYFDRSPRFPYCRQTAFAEKYPQSYAACMPALQEASALFAEHAPEQHARQQKICEQTSPDFVIPGTVFTTITLNRNFRTGYHRDAGDYADGFGVLTYYRGGRFNGGYLVFPAWRVALKLDSLDCVLFDPHEIHGNTEIVALKPGWERITCVHYYRANMHVCGSAEQELELARNHDPRQGARSMKADPKAAPCE